MSNDELIIEIEKQYYQSTSKNFDFLVNHNIPKTEISSLLLIFDFNKYNIDNTINYFIYDYRKINIFNIEQLKNGIKSFLEFYSIIKDDVNYIDFIEYSARLYINLYKSRFVENGYKMPSLPRNKLTNTIFLDLASGFDFINFFPNLESDTIYYLVDKSRFTCNCLNMKVNDLNLSNVKILNKDVNDLIVSDFQNDVGLIRAKNLFCYVDNYFEIINSFMDLLTDNGIIVFQESSMDHTIYNPIANYKNVIKNF